MLVRTSRRVTGGCAIVIASLCVTLSGCGRQPSLATTHLPSPAATRTLLGSTLPTPLPQAVPALAAEADDATITVTGWGFVPNEHLYLDLVSTNIFSVETDANEAGAFTTHLRADVIPGIGILGTAPVRILVAGNHGSAVMIAFTVSLPVIVAVSSCDEITTAPDPSPGALC